MVVRVTGADSEGGDMKKNMGTADRTIRTILALVVGVLYFTGTIGGTLGLVLLVFAVVFVATSAVGFCPSYVPLKLSTRKEPPAA
jgi:K+-transporting ATPase A subunit